MHVDVDALRRDSDAQHVGRLALTVQHVFIGRTHCVGDETVAHVAAVDVDILLVGSRACGFGQAGESTHAQRPGVQAERHALRHELGTEHVEHALACRRAAPVQQRLAVMPGRELDVRARQGVAPHCFQAMREFGRVGLEELSACRGAEEQLAYLERRAWCARRGLQLAAARIQAVRMCGVGGAARQLNLGHGADGGQGLTAKTHGRHRFEIAERGDLARRVAPQCERQFSGFDALAVVFDDDRTHPAAAEFDADLDGACVEGVVQELPYDGKRPVDDLAGRDLAGNVLPEEVYPPGGLTFGHAQPFRRVRMLMDG